MRSEELEYFESKEFRETLRQYESALHEGGHVYMDADELTDIAEFYMIKMREEEANECIEIAIKLHPEATDPQVFIARQHLFHEQIEEARSVAGAIADQDDREVKFLWAEIHIKEGDTQKADNLLLNYYDTLTEDADLFLYDTAGVFMDYEEWEYAEKWAKKLKTAFPDFKRSDLLICDILVSCGKVKEAVPLLEEILNTDPYNVEAWNLLAEAESGQEHYKEALEAIDYLLAINEKHLRGQLIRAHCLYHLNRIKEAHEQYQAYLQLEPHDASALYLDAVTLTHLEQYGEAKKLLEQAKDVVEEGGPELCNIYLQIAYILSKEGNKEQALEAIEIAYTISGQDKDIDYDLLKGHIMLENKDIASAELCFESAMSKSDDIHSTQLMIAVSWAENEYYIKALDILNELMLSDMEDKNERCLPYLAYCTHFIPGQPHYKELLHWAAVYNPSLTEYLFSPIYPNTPIGSF